MAITTTTTTTTTISTTTYNNNNLDKPFLRETNMVLIPRQLISIDLDLCWNIWHTFGQMKISFCYNSMAWNLNHEWSQNGSGVKGYTYNPKFAGSNWVSEFYVLHPIPSAEMGYHYAGGVCICLLIYTPKITLVIFRKQ